MHKKALLVICACGLLFCFGRIASAASVNYTMGVSGEFVELVSKLGQRIDFLEARIEKLEEASLGCAATVSSGQIADPIIDDVVAQEMQIQPVGESSATSTGNDVNPTTNEQSAVEPLVVDQQIVNEISEEIDSQQQELIVVPQVATPTVGSVLINEFVADSVSGEKEWVEIYNNFGSPVDLTGWTIEEGSGLKTKLSGTLGVESYAVFDRSSLNNSGDVVLLKNELGVIIDSVVYGDWNDGNIADNAPVAVKGQSVAVVDNIFVVTTKITKAGANEFIPPVVEYVEVNIDPTVIVDEPIVQPSAVEAAALEIPTVVDQPIIQPQPQSLDFSDQLFINEIFPDPDGDDSASEWIEIFNAGDVPVNLYKWKIDDIDGGSNPYEVNESLIIQALGYAVFPRKETLIILNNDKDSARLIDPAGKVVSSVSYSSPLSGQSFANFSAGWAWSAKVTPGAVNESLTSGVATGEQSEDPAPASALVTVAKKKTVSLVKTAYAKTAVPAQPSLFQISGDGVTAENIGKLVSISGEIVDKTGRKIYLDDGVGEAAVYFTASIDFNLASIGVGDKLKVVGLVKQYKDEVRIAPRNGQDIVIVEKAAKVDIAKAFDVKSSESRRWVLYLMGFFMFSVGGTLLFLNRRSRFGEEK